LGLLRAAGIPSQEISVDKTSEPYRTFRSAVYEGRVQLPDLEHLRMEMISLEYLADKDKIDHPPKGTKDASTRYAAQSSPVPAIAQSGRRIFRCLVAACRSIVKQRPSAAMLPDNPPLNGHVLLI
jgi:hypothetical protein